jgi:hypothetical protein
MSKDKKQVKKIISPIELLGKGQARKAAKAIREKRRKQKAFLDSL